MTREEAEQIQSLCVLSGHQDKVVVCRACVGSVLGALGCAPDDHAPRITTCSACWTAHNVLYHPGRLEP